MEIEIQFTDWPIAEQIPPPGQPGMTGAWLEFRGVVRGEENGQAIHALEYEAYPEMAVREIRRLLQEISSRHPCHAAKVIHRVGVIPVGKTAIYVGVASPHRGEAIALLAEFMDRLKQDVPIWKRQARSAEHRLGSNQTIIRNTPSRCSALQLCSLDEARAEIRSHSRPLPAVHAPLAEALGRVLRETICAPEDLPPVDRSTRDGYAIRADDASETFVVVDTIHAADWKPRQLKPGEAVRVATGAALPCGGLRVVMQEHVERNGGQFHVLRREDSTNVRLRGEEVRQGQPLLLTGTQLNAGALAILATVGNATPLVSPRLRILHFTTGDEIVAPDQTPKPGQVRDSNSILIHGLLRNFPCDVVQAHLPEDFEVAKQLVSTFNPQPSTFNLLLISGGASVGEKDFTRPLLEWLGFEILFSQINLRPGRPLIFGVNGPRVAFGLPGNPLSHFVCFHFAVAIALAGLTGGEPPEFLRGQLGEKFDDNPCPRETLWPARWEWHDATAQLHPLAWASSGDITCLTAANALVRVPANCASLENGAKVDFLPVASIINGIGQCFQPVSDFL
jgi:molybdopterin molybdotransferase